MISISTSVWMQSAGNAVVPAGPAAAAFLARTSGLDTLHTNAYATLINGLVVDGVWPKLDVLYVFATKDAATALLNLTSASFNGVANGAPAFAPDLGYTGVDGSTTVYIDSTFNSTTAPSPNFSQNSSHLSAWSNTNAIAGASGGIMIGVASAGLTAPASHLIAKFSDGKDYFRINDNVFGGGVVNANSTGHYVGSRSGASAQAGYRNAVDQGIASQASGAPPNAPISILAVMNVGGAVSFGSALQIGSASIGGNLSPTDVTNFYNRLRSYMTAVGVP